MLIIILITILFGCGDSDDNVDIMGCMDSTRMYFNKNATKS